MRLHPAAPLLIPKENKERCEINGYKIPFGSGRRMCAGISFAPPIMKLQLANLLYHFDWKLPDGQNAEDLDMTEAFGFVNKRKHDLCLVPIPYHPMHSSK